MTGRERIEAALSEAGTPEIGCVIPYPGIYIRDHWRGLTDCPWWYQHSPDPDQQLAWRRDVLAATGLDWFRLPTWYTRDERESLTIDVRGDGVWRLRRCQNAAGSGRSERLVEPQPSGRDHFDRELSGGYADKPAMPETEEEIDACVPPPPEDPAAVEADGRGDLAALLMREFGAERAAYYHVSSPLWMCYGRWDFEDTMVRTLRAPGQVIHACERMLARSIHEVRVAALLGADVVWIEECMTDMIAPGLFAEVNVPFVRRLVEAIRQCGMKSIYYYCGDPEGKWEHILSVGADALSLEEGKKGFEIDMEDVARRVGGGCTLLGNLDAVGVLQNGTRDALRREIERQIAAGRPVVQLSAGQRRSSTGSTELAEVRPGRENGSRFIMSLGSPVTPETPPERVRLYRDTVREIGSA